MNVRIWLRAASASVVLLVPARADAQLTSDCDAQLVEAQTSAHVRHPVNFLARMKAMLDADRHRDAVSALLADVRADARLTNSDPRRRALEDRLELFRDAEPGSVDLAYTRVTMDLVSPPNADVYELFVGTEDVTVLTASTPTDERRAICWTVISARQILAAMDAPEIADALKIMQRTSRQWENYERNGYSMYPWESLLLGVPGFRKCAETNLGPPRCTPIVLHANGGMEVSGLGRPGDEGWTDLRSRGVIVWDVIGFVAYSRDWRRYWGLAAAVVTGGEQSPAIGPALHIGRAIELGAVFRGPGATGPRQTMILSVDAFRAFSDLPKRFAGARDKIEAALGTP